MDDAPHLLVVLGDNTDVVLDDARVEGGEPFLREEMRVRGTTVSVL